MPVQEYSQRYEDIATNVVKIVDMMDEFYGTGFIVEYNEFKYCITCHHCIYKIQEIYIENVIDDKKKKLKAEWIEELSDMSQDIAVLRITEDNSIRPLLCAPNILSGLPVYVYGFPLKFINTAPGGRGSPEQLVETKPNRIRIPKKESTGPKNWNKSPEVNIRAYMTTGDYDLGYSGAPVLHSLDNVVVGMFVATEKDSRVGYIIPINTILSKLQKNLKLLSATQETRQKEHIDKAKEFVKLGQYKEAISEYDQVIKDENYMIALYNIASIYYNKGEYLECLEYCEKILKLDAEHLNALLLKGQIKYYLEEYEVAENCYKIMLQKQSNNINALVSLGKVFLFRSNYDEGIQYCLRVLRLDSNNTSALNSIGDALLLKRKYKDAAKYFNLVREKDKNDVYALCKLGFINAINGESNYDEFFEQAISLDPNNYMSYKLKGDTLTYIGNYEDAEKTYNIALEIRKDDHIILNALAKVNIILGNYDKAEDYLNQITGILSKTISTLTNKSILKALKNDYEVDDPDDPIITLKEVLKKDPYNHEALLYRAIILDAAGAYSEAKTEFDKATVLDPKGYLYLIAKGFSMIYEEDFVKAKEHFTEILNINPNSIEGLLGLGLLFDAMEEYRSAITQYDKILQINPMNIFAKRYKAFALAQTGDIKAAADTID